MNLSQPFIQRPVMTALLTLSSILFGVLAYTQLPVNDLPVVDYPVIQVSVGYPGATPETMANTIATPLERQFMQIPGLELVTSTSRQGFTSFTLQFALSKSIDAAATDVQTAISQATGKLPADLPSPPTFSKTNPNDQPIMYIGLTSDSVTRGQLYDYASTQAGQRISILPGVSRVQVYGTQSAMRIKADPSAMAARGITIDDLHNAVQRGTSYSGAGQIDGPHKSFLIQPQGQLDTAESYNDLIVGTQGGSPVYLKDVATAVETVQDERIDMRFWVRGKTVPKATVVIAVFRQAGANAVEVADSIRALVPIVSAQLPSSVSIVPIYDRSRSIVNSIKDVEETLVIAFILVVAVIFIFLGRATDTVIPAVALPLSLLLTFIVMRMLDYSLDNLSLMALTLAIGFLVDDAIVFLENAVRRMEKFNETPLVAAVNGAREISFTILSMTISLAAVFIPLVFMTGLVGRIFREFAVTIIVAIMASGVVSLTLTPLMCARLLSQRGHGMKKSLVERVIDPIEHFILRGYGGSLWFFLRHRWVSMLIWIACLGGTFWFYVQVPKSFLPAGDSSFIRGVMIAEESASPEQMHTYQGMAEQQMQANPSVKMTFSMSGNGQFIGSNMGFLLAFLDDPKDRPPLKTFDGTTVEHPPIQLVAADLMGRIASNVPGIFPALQPDPVLQISTGASSTQQGKFSYAVSGIDPAEVYATAHKLMNRMYAELGPGKMFQTVLSDLYTNTPNLKVTLNREQAKMNGVSESRILALLRNAYSQNYVYLIKRPNDQYQVILEVADNMRKDPADLSLLYIKSDDGKRIVPLKAVADWEPGVGPQAVNHINQFTSVSIAFNLNPGVPIGNATSFIEAQAKEVVPSYIRGDLQGEALTFRNTVRDLAILGLVAVFVMYVILGILYESYLHPITVLSSLPVALVGGLLTLWLFGEEMSLYGWVGVFMLMGIVKKNGIMIVDFANQRVAEGQADDVAIHEASVDRFRPIIMTTLAALMGAVPIALGLGADGASRRPLGLVIIGGLIVSQFITLFITPAIYLYLEDFQEHVLNRFSFFRSTHVRKPHFPVPDAQAASTTSHT